MPSKKTDKTRPVAEKRAATQPRQWDKTKRFQKDWDRLSKSGRYDMGDLKRVMLALIANDVPLPPERKDHRLSGHAFADCRECHVHGDYLLVYQLTENDTIVVFTAIGTHAELFS